jgi:transcriptional regulator with XRE-family HTH domain
MTGEEVHRTRLQIGERLGRRISQLQLGLMVGLERPNAARTIRRWEADSPTGPGALALEYLLRLTTIELETKISS